MRGYMRLTRVAIKNYKHLENIVLETQDSQEEFPVYFCIGLNGSGKSTFLEALALIFSRIAQNELPGFWFEIEYDIWRDGTKVQVKVSPEKNRKKGKLRIQVNGDAPFYSFEGREQFLPYKVITYVSGPNSGMEQLVTASAEDSIVSDVYDAVVNEDTEQINSLLGHLRALSNNPRILYLGEDMAALILFVLCAWKPKYSEAYEEKRSILFQKLAGGFRPKVLSISANDNLKSGLFGVFFEKKRKRKDTGLADWVIREEEGITAGMLVDGAEASYCVKSICDEYSNPLQLLTVLLRARNTGELRECHVQFQTEKGEDFLNEQALSDGELLWIARMGLVLLAGQQETNNCLFLFDEPDVHLNESWNVEFISLLKQLSKCGQQEHNTNNFWISTHSSLLLTDALPEHVFLFERNTENISAKRVPISFFGASRYEISESAFANDARIGEFAEEWIEEVIADEKQTSEQLLQFINMTGAGIQRIRLLDKYYEMIKR